MPLSSNKPLSTDDIDMMIQSGEYESRTLDFKSQWWAKNDDGKRDLCTDIAAIANAAGGRIVIGIMDEDGKARSATPVDECTYDQEVRRLTQVISSGITPRLNQPHIYPISSVAGKIFVVIDITKSWTGPHWIRINDTYRMPMRYNTSNVSLDGYQMKAAVMGMAELPSQIRNWKGIRLALVRSNMSGTTVGGWNRPCAVIHIIPWASFANRNNEDAVDIKQAHLKWYDLSPVGNSTKPRITADGLWVVSDNKCNGGYYRYTLWFRDGCVESVSEMIAWNRSGESICKLHPQWESLLIHSVSRIVQYHKQSGVAYPASVHVCLVNMLGVQYVNQHGEPLGECDRAEVPAVETTIQSWDEDVANALKRAIDGIWNAFNVVESPSYQNGMYVGARTFT